MRNEKFKILCDTTFMVLALRSFTERFPYLSQYNVNALPEFPPEPIECFLGDGAVERVWLNEEVYLINENTMSLFRDFLRLHFPDVFSRKKITYTQPHYLNGKKLKKLREEIIRLHPEFNGYQPPFGIREGVIYGIGDDRYYYERLTTILLLALSVCRGRMKDRRIFYYARRSFLPHVLNVLQKKKFLHWEKNDRRGHYVTFTETGKKEGERLFREYFPDADPLVLNLYSPENIKRLKPRGELLVEYVDSAQNKVTSTVIGK